MPSKTDFSQNTAASILSKYQHIYVEQNSTSTELGQRVLALAEQNHILDKVTVCVGKPNIRSSGDFSGEEYSLSKKLLFITEHSGAFFKRCPGAKKGLACCNYFVLNLGLQCDMDCTYCYLQSFINTPYTIIYSNIDKALSELDLIYNDFGQQTLRIGTGEVIDSLSLDPLTLYSKKLIHYFKDKPQWRLEFKSKSNFVDQFLTEPHGKNVIVSWSVNPEYIVAKEEHKTATLSERLIAARKCLDHNFQIALHIDPVIWHTEWKTNYTLLIDEITERFQPHEMPYISLGSLRFKSDQKNIMRERFGMDSLVNRAETFAGAAGKMRYDQSLREDMFEFIISEFKKRSEHWKIFLCMETPETWVKSTGQLPHKTSNVSHLFKPIHVD